MKKALLIALSLLPFLGISQTTKPIDGFLGIKFGSTRQAVIAAMTAKGAVVDKQHTRDDHISFSHVKLGRRAANAFFVKFVDNKAYEADYFFKPDVEGHLLTNYSELIDDISLVYGKGESTYKYDSPYKADEDNSDTLVGLSVGKIDYHTVWIDRNTKSGIFLAIDADMSLELNYQDNKLADAAEAKQQAKEKSDF